MWWLYLTITVFGVLCLLLLVYVLYKLFIYIHISKYVTPYSTAFPSGSDDNKKASALGFDEAKKKSLVLCGLLRDVSDRIDVIKAKTYATVGMFERYAVLLVENDSQDDTRQKLLAWAREDSNVKILGCGVNVDICTLNLLKTQGHNGTKSRIEKMALLRNIYVSYVLENYMNYDYMMVIDMDIVGSCYLDGIAHAVYHLNNFNIDAIGANGLSVMIKLHYYDPFALLFLGEDIEYGSEQDRRSHDEKVFKMLENVKRDDPLIPVRSCFGGAALYNMKRIDLKNRRYSFPSNPLKSGCEHCYFNDGLKMFIDPYMIYAVVLND